MSNPLAHLRSNPWYANQVAGAVGEFITQSWNRARALEAEVQQDLDDLDAMLDRVLALPIYANTLAGISFDYTEPVGAGEMVRGNYAALQPTSADMPARAGLLPEAASEALFTKARARVARGYATGAQAAFYQAGAGVGMGAGKLHTALRQVEQDAKDKTAQVAIEQAVQEGVWYREDVKAILELELQQFKARWDVIAGRLKAEEDTLMGNIAKFEARLKAEGERRGWTTIQVDAVLREEIARVQSGLNAADIRMRQLFGLHQEIVKVKASLAQSYLQLADTNLSFDGSQSISSDGN